MEELQRIYENSKKITITKASVDTDSDASFISYLPILQEILSIQEQEVFLSHILCNKPLHLLITQYLNVRQRPIVSTHDKNDSLVKVDETVFIIYYRMSVCATCAERKIANYISLLDKKKQSAAVTASSTAAENPFVKSLSNYAKVIEIIGESNLQLSQKLVNGIVGSCDAYYLAKELSSMIKEHSRNIQTIIDRYGDGIDTETKVGTNALISSGKEKKHTHLSSKKGATPSIQPYKKTERRNLLSSSVSKDVATEDDINALVNLCKTFYSLSMLLQSLSASSLLQHADVQLFAKDDDALKVYRLTNLGYELIAGIVIIYERVIPYFHTLFATYSDADFIQDMINFSIKRCLKCVDNILKSSTIQIFAGKASSATISNGISTSCLSWFNCIDKLNRCHNGYLSGALFCDMAVLYHHTMLKVLSLDDHADLDYYMYSLLETGGYFSVNQVTSEAAAKILIKNTRNSSTISSSSIDPTSTTTTTTTAATTTAAAKVYDTSKLKDLFPSYGDAFIVACLVYFDNNPDRVVDALLDDNLPPQLQAIDREAQQIWKGKKGFDDLHNSSIGYSKDASAIVSSTSVTQANEYKQREKQRVRELERQQEYDSMLIDKEYGDDYDDQYDDAYSASTLSRVDGQNNKSMSAKDKKAAAAAAPVINWDVRMKETKRINQLIREEESEIAFWKEMEVNNYSRAVDDGDSSDGMNDDIAVNSNNASSSSSSSSSSYRTRRNDNKNGSNNGSTNSKNNSNNTSGSSSTSGSSNKHRTKMFDKHHQKDKAQRKFTHFG